MLSSWFILAEIIIQKIFILTFLLKFLLIKKVCYKKIAGGNKEKAISNIFEALNDIGHALTSGRIIKRQ